MKIYKIKDIWSYIGCVDAICVTTNGYVTSKGESVMGRGIALSTATRYKNINIKKILGKSLIKNGNHVSILHDDNGTKIISFPVKRGFFDFSKDNDFPGVVRNLKYGTTIPGWALKAEVSLIKRSAQELMNIVNENKFKKVLLTQPGCNNGGLNWCDVSNEISTILDDRIFIVKK
jgi:hypothetical protein